MLQALVDWLVYGLIGMDSATRLGSSLNFFIYDSVKIIILLFVMITAVGYLRTYMHPDKVKNWLSKSRFGLGNFFAALFGAVTPFCSCSSVPIFLSFIRAGVPLGVSFSFLITSPLVNEYLVVLMISLFGWKITLAYVIFGILIGFFGGIILGRMKLEHLLVRDMTHKGSEKFGHNFRDGFEKRIKYSMSEALSMVKKLWYWILIGVGLGALIHNFVPKELVEKVVSKTGLFSVPLAVMLGVPAYANCVAILPIASALFDKGFPLGTSLAFMMALAALSLPEAIILRRAMKLKMILIFFGIVAASIIMIGYLFNALEPILAI